MYLWSHPTDGGNIVASTDKVPSVMFQLEVSQPLEDRFLVLKWQDCEQLGNESNKENTDGDAKKRIDQIKDVTPADPNPGENPKDLTCGHFLPFRPAAAVDEQTADKNSAQHLGEQLQCVGVKPRL